MSEKPKEASGAQSAAVEISPEARQAAEEAKRQDAATTELPDTAKAALEAQLAEALSQAAANYDQYLRTAAELDNYRKRVARERQDLLRFGNENLLREFLPVVDNLERALEHARGQDNSTGSLLQGVEMTLVQCRQVLGKFGVTPIEALQQPFDPACHEAIGQLATDQAPPGTVAQVMQAGYLLNERLLRPSMVLVARAPEEGSTVGDADSATQDDN